MNPEIEMASPPQRSGNAIPIVEPTKRPIQTSFFCITVGAVYDRPHSRNCSCLAILVIVFLSIDVVAGTMQFSVQPLAFSHGELSIRAGIPLIDSNACLLRFQTPGF